MPNSWAVGLALCLLPATPAAALCYVPSALSCATSYGAFSDQWDFDRCKNEMESYHS